MLKTKGEVSMKITKIRKELQDVYSIISGVNLKGVKFNFKLVKLKKIIKEILEAVQEADKPNEDYLVFTNKRNELLKKYGVPGTPNNDGSIPYSFEDGNDKEFVEEENKLREEFSDAIKEREKQFKETLDLLDGEETIEVDAFNIDEIPEEIETAQMEYLLDFIEDN